MASEEEIKELRLKLSQKAKDLTERESVLDEQEKELSTKQRQFELRMKEQTDLLNKDKNIYKSRLIKQEEEQKYLDAQKQKVSKEEIDRKQQEQEEKKEEAEIKISIQSENEKDFRETTLQQNDKITSLNQQIEELQEKIKEQGEHIIFIQKEKQNQRESAQRVENQVNVEVVEQLHQENADLRQKLAEIQTKNENMQKQIKNLETDAKKFKIKKPQNPDVKKQLELQKSESERLKRECASKAEQIKNLETKLKNQKDSYELLKNEKTQIEIQLENQQKTEIFQLQEDSKQIDKVIGDYENKLKFGQAEKVQLQQNLDEVNEKFKVFKKKYKTLKEQAQLEQGLLKQQEIDAKDLEIETLKHQISKQTNLVTGNQTFSTEINTDDDEIQNLKKSLQNSQIKNKELEIQLKKALQQIQEKDSPSQESHPYESDEFKDLRVQLEFEKQEAETYKQISQDLNQKLKRQANKEQNQDQNLQEKQNEIMQKIREIDEKDKEIIEMKIQQKKQDLKLRQLTQTKLKDLQRDVRTKDRKITELGQKIQMLMANQDKQLNGSKSTAKARHYRSNSDMSTIGDHRKNSITSRGDQYDQRNKITEVHEEMENTGYIPKMPPRHTTGQSPTRLPSIHKNPSQQFDNRSRMSNFRDGSFTDPKSQYNHKLNQYDSDRKNRNFANNSGRMNGLISGKDGGDAGGSSDQLTEEQRQELLDEKLEKINHVLDQTGPNQMWF